MRRAFGMRYLPFAGCVLLLNAAAHLTADDQVPHLAIPTYQPEALVPLSNGRYLELNGSSQIGPRVPSIGQYFATVYEMPAANGTTGTTGGGVGSNFNFADNPLLGSPTIFAKATFEDGDFQMKALDFEGSTPASIDIQDTSTTAALQYNNANVTVKLTVVLSKNGKDTTISGSNPIVIPKGNVRVDGNAVRIQFGPTREADPPVAGTMATELRKALRTHLFPSQQAEQLAIKATIVFGRTPDIASAGGDSGSAQDPHLASQDLEKKWTDANKANTAFQIAATAAIKAQGKAINGDPRQLVQNDKKTLDLINTALNGQMAANPPVLSLDDTFKANTDFASAAGQDPGAITPLTANAFQAAVTAGATAQAAIAAAKYAITELKQFNDNANDAQDAFNGGNGQFHDNEARLAYWTRLATEGNAKAVQALDAAAKALAAMTKAYATFADGTVQSSNTSSLASFNATVGNSLTLDLARLAKLSRAKHPVGPPYGI